MRLFKIKDVPISEGAGKQWAWLERYMIPTPDDDDYLRRLRIIQTPWFGIYCHEMYTHDLDRDLHDHPWWFASLVVKGHYSESYRHTRDVGAPWLDWTRVNKRWSLHTIRLDECHRITSIAKGTTTLLLVGPRVRTWGFYTEDGWVPFNEYDRL